MPKKPSATTVKKPAAKKAARKTPVKKTVAKKTSVKKVAAKPDTPKRPRAKVLNEHPANILVDANDPVAIERVASATAKSIATSRVSHRRSAVDRLDDPPAGSEGSLVERVSDAIERELSKIERIIGHAHIPPVQRTETESRARVLASLARTLKEVMRLREQERGADEERAKAADDDAVPRDLDEFRRELSRRLEGLVGSPAPLPAGGNEQG